VFFRGKPQDVALARLLQGCSIWAAREKTPVTVVPGGMKFGAIHNTEILSAAPIVRHIPVPAMGTQHPVAAFERTSML